MSGRPDPAGQTPPVVRWLDQDAPVPGTQTPVSRRSRSSWLPLIAIGVLVLALVVERRGGRDVIGPVPAEFLGVWQTAETRYQDRGFTITADSLWLRLGPDVTIAYPVVGARKRHAGDAVLYTIVYGDSPAVQEMELQLGSDATIRLPSSPSVHWNKRE